MGELLRQSRQFVVTLSCSRLGQFDTGLSNEFDGMNMISVECSTMGGEQILVKVAETDTMHQVKSYLAKAFDISPVHLILVQSDGSLIHDTITHVSCLLP